MHADDPRAVVSEVLQDVLREVLDEQIERLIELLLKEITGINTQILQLQTGIELAASARGAVGASGDLSELIAAATARGGRFF